MATIPHTPTRVVKVGGSLLRDTSLPARLQQFLDSDPNFRHILIVGGGGLVECVRQWHHTYGLPQEHCHWSSIRLMRETARLLTQLCPQLGSISDLDELPSQGDWVFDCWAYMCCQSALPQSWDTTSDSIAAEIAQALQADELWLLKSALPPSPSIADWHATGLVDRHFAQTVCSSRPVFVANLKDPDLLWMRGN